MAKTIVTLLFVASLAAFVNADYLSGSVDSFADVASATKDALFIISELLLNIYSMAKIPELNIKRAKSYQNILHSNIETSATAMYARELIYSVKNTGRDVTECKMRLRNGFNSVYGTLFKMSKSLMIDYSATYRESLRKHEKTVHDLVDFNKIRNRLMACYQELEVLNKEYAEKYGHNSDLLQSVTGQLVESGIYNPTFRCVNRANVGDGVKALRQKVVASIHELNRLVFKERVNASDVDQIYDMISNWKSIFKIGNVLYEKEGIEKKDVEMCRLLMNRNIHKLVKEIKEKFDLSIDFRLDYDKFLFNRQQELLQSMTEVLERPDSNYYDYLMRNYLDQAELLKREYAENNDSLYKILNEKIRNIIFYPTLSCLSKL